MAYQGKFSQPRNTEENIRLKQQAAKKAAAQAEEAKTPARDTSAVTEAPAAKPAASRKASKQAAPAAAKAVPAKKGNKKKKKKANRTITIIFYTCYFAMVAAILGGLFYANNWITGWLTDYEASQPTNKCEEIFQANFADPDWAALYALADVANSEYESSEAFAAYMEAKVGANELSYVETSAGLSGGHKYLLKLGDETIGYFTLVDNAPKGAEVSSWQLGQVSLNYTCSKSVTIQTMDGITVYVNGVALTDDHVIQIGTTKVEDYLPEGVHGPRIYTQYLDGLMVEPEVTATDADGNPMEVTYNADTGIYLVLTAENSISDEEYERVLMTAKTYALRMIEKASTKELGKYFDTSSDSYKTIISIDPWMQEWFFSSYEWGQESITGYFRHSDDLFSVHVDLPMLVTRTDGSVKEYKIDHSFFFKKQSGTWKCTNMINVDIQEQTSIVRLTFKLDDSVIFTNLFEQDVSTLELPTVTAPEGKVFAGWFRLDTAADGSIEYTRVFAPDEDGVVELPDGTHLEPMTLYALFEDASENGG